MYLKQKKQAAVVLRYVQHNLDVQQVSVDVWQPCTSAVTCLRRHALHDMLTDGFAGGRMDVSAYQGAEGASEALQSRHCKRGAVSARYRLLVTCFRTQRMLAFIPYCQQYMPVIVCMRVQNRRVVNCSLAAAQCLPAWSLCEFVSQIAAT